MSLRSEVIRIVNELLGNSKKISELPAASALTGTEQVEVNQAGTSVRTTTQDIADLGGGGGGAVSSVFARTGAVTAQSGDYSVAQVTGAAALASPTFTGVPAAPTAATTTNTTQLATTAFVQQEITERVIGLQDLFISAAAMWPRSTNGCAALAQTEVATSLFNIQTLDFDQTTQEFAQFQISLPRNWNNGTITAKVYWTATSGSGTVQWGISGGAYSNDDALTVALGTAQTVDDTLIATNDLHITDATSAITLAGTPADADFLAIQVSRNPASDTLSADAKLLGVVITITTDAAKAA